jgi:hypothetical protein
VGGLCLTYLSDCYINSIYDRIGAVEAAIPQNTRLLRLILAINGKYLFKSGILAGKTNTRGICSINKPKIAVNLQP